MYVGLKDHTNHTTQIITSSSISSANLAPLSLKLCANYRNIVNVIIIIIIIIIINNNLLYSFEMAKNCK